MKSALAIAGLTALMLASAPSAAGADADRPRVSLSVSPARLALTAPGARTIKVRNDGAERVVIDATRRTPDPQTATKTWLQIVPARLSLRSGESATLTIRVKQSRRAEPGDHQVLVLLTTRALRGGRVNVQVRLGVRIKVVVRGHIVRRLTLGSLRVHRRRDARFLFVSIANRGNVTLRLRGPLAALLVRRGQQLARLSSPACRVLLPGARAVLALRYRGHVRGVVTAVVHIGFGVRIVERRYRIRL